MTEPADASEFRLAYVPGVTPGKWERRWSERVRAVPMRLVSCPLDGAEELVLEGRADAAVTRLGPAVEGLSTIPLYDETPVVVIGNDHLFTAVDEVSPADLADEQLLLSQDDPLVWSELPARLVEHRPATTVDAVELVAAGVGVLVVPQSLARLHHRRDLTSRPVTGGPSSTVGLVWREPVTDLVEEFIGVVRGRTANSSRGRSAEGALSSGEQAPKRTAKQKAAAKRAAREAAGKVPGRNFGKSAGRRDRRR